MTARKKPNTNTRGRSRKSEPGLIQKRPVSAPKKMQAKQGDSGDLSKSSMGWAEMVDKGDGRGEDGLSIGKGRLFFHSVLDDPTAEISVKLQAAKALEALENKGVGGAGGPVSAMSRQELHAEIARVRALLGG